MKIENQVTTQKVVSISYEDYLDYCRTKFGIIESANGNAEIVAVSEAVAMMSHSLVYDRNVADVEIRKEICIGLSKLYKDAANYAELLHAQIEFAEKERKEKEYEDHARSIVGH